MIDTVFNKYNGKCLSFSDDFGLGRRQDDSPSAILRARMSGILSEISSFEDSVQAQLASLLRNECYVSTELLQMEQRTPRYSTERFPERLRFQLQLSRIEKERRGLAMTKERRLGELRRELSDLVLRQRKIAE